MAGGVTLRREKFSGPVELSDSDEDPAMAPTVEGRLLFEDPAFQAELAITFVMLMAAGAGVAAIVFYDRVLRIITTW